MNDRSPASQDRTVQEMLRHSDALFRYALPRVNNRAAAEDLVQETLLTAVDKRSTFTGASAMRTWLIGILRHKILDHYRWQARHPGDQPSPEIPDNDDNRDPWFTALGVWRTDPNDGLEVLDDNPGRAVERSQLRAALRRCIERLPGGLRRVFVLRELEECSSEETCAAADVASASLPVILYRARQSLRSCMQKKWGSP